MVESSETFAKIMNLIANSDITIEELGNVTIKENKKLDLTQTFLHQAYGYNEDEMEREVNKMNEYLNSLKPATLSESQNAIKDNEMLCIYAVEFFSTLQSKGRIENKIQILKNIIRHNPELIIPLHKFLTSLLFNHL